MLASACAFSTAFAPIVGSSGTPVCQARLSDVRCALEPPVASRRAVMAGALGLGASGVAPAWAGYVTSLGIVTTKPKDAEKDDDLLATKEVQSGLANIKQYKQKAAALQACRATPAAAERPRSSPPWTGRSRTAGRCP